LCPDYRVVNIFGLDWHVDSISNLSKRVSTVQK
jgi:hypothetical protein